MHNTNNEEKGGVHTLHWYFYQELTMSKKVLQTLQRQEVRKKYPLFDTSTWFWQIGGTKHPWDVSLCVWKYASIYRKQRDYLLMFISSSLYPLASISPCSRHQLMCVVLKSNLYHLNESKAPQQNSGSPISTHQLLPLKSLIIWAGLQWLVGLLMWCRLLVFLFPLASSQTLAKTLVGKAITHWQLCYYLPKQWCEAAIFKFTLGVVFA